MLEDLFNKFFRKYKEGNLDPALNDSAASKHHNWYSDRYETIITQRNFLIILTILSFVAVIVAVAIVGKISTSKSFSPFVIQIDEKSGAAKIVNPADSSLLNGNESLSRYFIKKYITARETYNPVDFDRNLKKIVRLYSAPDIYREYIGYIRTPQNDPTVIYGQKNTTYLKINSFTQLGKQYFIRFSVIETLGSKKVIDKIATLTIDYKAMELSEDDRDINPVGFQITGYRVDNDNS